MTIWIDAQLPPAVAAWISADFPVQAVALRDLGLRDATDLEIFRAAREADTLVMTKDSDFIDLLSQYGPPPQLIWLTCGNTSNTSLKLILAGTLANAIELLRAGEPLVEISAN
ncbi:MAG: DUF5615 family PIN-like protein [Blastocatellia bacterium]